MGHTYYIGNIPFDSDDAIMHYRTKGSKNGVRRYQREDGSLTPLGRIHYGIGEAVGGVRDAFSKEQIGRANRAAKSIFNRGINYLTGNSARSQMNRAQSSNAIERLNSSLNSYRDTRTQYKSNVLNPSREAYESAKNKGGRSIEYTKKSHGSSYDSDIDNKRYNMNSKGLRLLERSRTSANAHGVMSDYNKARKEAGYDPRKTDTARKEKEHAEKLDRISGERARMAERGRNAAAMHRTMAMRNAEYAYSQTLPGQLENMEKSLSKTMSEVTDYLSDNAKKASKKAKKAIQRATKAVSDAASKTVSSIKSEVSKASASVANFFKGLFG